MSQGTVFSPDFQLVHHPSVKFPIYRSIAFIASFKSAIPVA